MSKTYSYYCDVCKKLVNPIMSSSTVAILTIEIEDAEGYEIKPNNPNLKPRLELCGHCRETIFSLLNRSLVGDSLKGHRWEKKNSYLDDSDNYLNEALEHGIVRAYDVVDGHR